MLTHQNATPNFALPIVGRPPSYIFKNKCSIREHENINDHKIFFNLVQDSLRCIILIPTKFLPGYKFAYFGVFLLIFLK